MERLVRLCDQTPTDVIVGQLSKLSLDSEIEKLLHLYNDYLTKVDDKDIRARLSKLSTEDAAKDEHFNWFKEQARKLHQQLGTIFLDSHPQLSKFTKEYAIF